MADRNAEKEPGQLDALPIEDEATRRLDLEAQRTTDAWSGGWPQSAREFEVLVDGWMDRMVSYAFRRVGNLADAEDVVQDVFVRAFAERSKRRKVARPIPYLYRMVANACNDCIRKRKHSTVSLDDLHPENLAGKGKTPSQIAIAAEEIRRAEQYLRRLPKRQAEAIRLRVFDGLRLNEIADVLGCSANTVGSRLRYGFQKLRAMASKERGLER